LLGVGGTFGGGGDSEQRSEGVEGIIPPVEAEDEFVEISLQVLMAHPVMGPDQPGLEVGKNAAAATTSRRQLARSTFRHW